MKRGDDMPVRAKYPRFPDYTGGELWRVAHPQYGMLECLAPDRTAAMTVAAQVWKTRWQSMEFYERCQISYVGLRKRAVLVPPDLP